MDHTKQSLRWILLLIASASILAGSLSWQSHTAGSAPTPHVVAGGGNPPGPNIPTP